MKISNTLYDIINKFQRWLPAIGSLYLGLAGIFGWYSGENINEVTILLSTFLATTLEIWSVEYYKSKDQQEK